MTLIVESQASSADLFVSAIGLAAIVTPSIEAMRARLAELPDEFAIVLGPRVDLKAAVNLAETLRVTHPALSVILLRNRIDATVLGDALRSGMREVVEERDLTGLALAVRRGHALHQALAAALNGSDSSSRGHMVTVFAAKGGVGKTTVATNLAVALGEMGKHVCLVDLDLGSGDVGIALQMFPQHTILDALAIDGELGPDELAPLLTKYSDNVYALLAPSSPELDGAVRRHLIGAVLLALTQSFDFVVVDCPPAFDDHVLQAFDESDLILLLLTLDIPALKNTKVALETLNLLNIAPVKLRVILNRADSKVGLLPSEVEKTLKTPISASIPSTFEVPASINRGEPIVTSLPKNPVSQILHEIARDCVASTGTATPAADASLELDKEASSKRHLFRRKSRTG